MKTALIRFTLLIALSLLTLPLQAVSVSVKSVSELVAAARKSNQTIKMEPGIYSIAEFLNKDSINSRLLHKEYAYVNFSGSNNKIILKNVHFEIDTQLREMLRHPIHTSEIVVSGQNNLIDGLKITCKGNGLSPGGSVMQVAGNGNKILNFEISVRGSFPYGYGDLFGKGGPDVIKHKKHSGFLITGSNTLVYGCRLIMRSYGHGFYIQQNAANIHFENCYVEGETRTTDDVLTEKSGPAFDVNFRTWTANREGKYIVTPGYMKSLCEDGFRTYGGISNVSFKNCTAKNTRGGFEIRTNNGIKMENCTTIGTERAYWVGNGAVVKNCKGDAAYGPLLFVEGSNVKVEITYIPGNSDRIVHSLATIQGHNNIVTLRKSGKKSENRKLPILVGYTHPEHGESMSPYSEAPCTNLKLINKTGMPVIVGSKAKTHEKKNNIITALNYCHTQTQATLSQLKNSPDFTYKMMPRNILKNETEWHLRKASKEEWTSGFWPGVLWYDYEYSKDENIRAEAEKYTASLEHLSRIPAFDHDLGFLIFCSYGNAYRLTGNAEYKEIILRTADTLATLFNPKVGTLLSWPRAVKDRNWPHNTIIDNMMNLELLFWAAKNGGNKSLYQLAVSHAEKTMKFHFKPDYSCYHVAVYDTITGEFIKGVTHQGYSDVSMWARGQAWAIYGFTVCYRETKDKKYLDFAQKLAETYLSRLPTDKIPYWDFDAPIVPDSPRDASAAAITASALIDLSDFSKGAKKQKYISAAKEMLDNLYENYSSKNTNPSFLLHSTGHKPAGSEIDASIIYADYYFIEAYKKLWEKNL